MGDRLMNEGPKWAITIVWLLANVGIFAGFFFYFHTTESYYYLRELTGGGSLPVARGSAACLNFNCMLILFPVCRNTVSWLRGSCKCCKRNIRRQLDNNIGAHRCIAYAIVFFTALHYFAHCFNMERLVDAHKYTSSNSSETLLSALTSLPRKEGKYINPISTGNTNAIIEVLKTLAGWTGVAATLALLLMVSSSTRTISHSYFEAFWFTHHLFILFFIAIIVHGFGGLVRSQTNTDEHDPEYCSKHVKDWGKADSKCAEPHFEAAGAQTWKWVLAPVVLYIIERIIRFYRSQQKVTVKKIQHHPSQVFELQMEKKGFHADAGQYIFLHCPQISRLEWHPFTLTSAPGDPFFSLHIRVAGDWTRKLSDLCRDTNSPPSVSVDGPFGTCSEDAYRYHVCVFIGAGIGVTPFASLLKDLWYKYSDPDLKLYVKKIYFFWIAPNTDNFEWFGTLLKDLEHQMKAAGKLAFLDYNIYLTRGWNTQMAQDICEHESDYYDVLTGLRQKTHYGRPDWERVFQNIAEAHQGTRIGVFFCGPKSLNKTLHELSNRFSSPDPKGTHFVYNKENF